MAYAATITVKRTGPLSWLVKIAETECSLTDEASVYLPTYRIPRGGRVVRQRCSKTSGTAGTVDPIMECVPVAAAPAVRATVVENAAPASAIDTEGVAEYNADTGYLYHRSRPDAGADNVLVSYYDLQAMPR